MSSSSRNPASFEELLGLRPLAVATAPGRINLIGEYTDLNDGFVLPVATRRCTRVEVAFSPDDHFRYHSVNLAETVMLQEGASPTAGFARYVHGCVEVLRRRGERVPAVVLRIDSDLPLGSGLSSSASLCVATLRVLRALLHLQIDDRELAHLARQAETEYAGVRTGLLDQLACSFCGPDQMLLIDTRTLDRRVMPMPAGTELVVLHSGVERELGNTAYNTRRVECEAAARALGLSSLRDLGDITALARLDLHLRRRAQHVVTENQRVLEAVNADAATFGALMNASHRSLRDDFEVSVPALDALVSVLQSDPQVLGARLTGAGFGGACVALVRVGSAPEVAARALAAHASAGFRGRLLV
jgi:galactokinase